MREMVDSKDLHKMAAFVLVFVTAVTPPIDIVKPLMDSLLKTLRESPVGLPHTPKEILKLILFFTVLENPTARTSNFEYHLLPRTPLG